MKDLAARQPTASARIPPWGLARLSRYLQCRLRLPDEGSSLLPELDLPSVISSDVTNNDYSSAVIIMHLLRAVCRSYLIYFSNNPSGAGERCTAVTFFFSVEKEEARLYA